MYFPFRKYMTGPRAASRARPAAAAESICAPFGVESEPRRRRARSALTSGSTFRHGTVSPVRPAGRFKIEMLPSRYLRQSHFLMATECAARR
jgi:hypothetical protein